MVYLGTNKISDRWLGTTLLNDKKIFPPLLNIYPATAAYSAGRRLKSSQTYAMTIRRESDNAELNIGFDANGDTDQAAIEEFGGYNLLGYSEKFDNAYWNLKAFSSISSNQIANPLNGQIDADKLIEDSTNNNHYLGRIYGTVSTSIEANTYYNFSVYVKAAEINVFRLWFADTGWDATNGTPFATINLSTGTLIDSEAVIDIAIDDVGDGWYRFSAAHITGTSGNCQLRYWLNSGAYQGNGLDGLYLWGAQLTKGSAVLPYQPRTPGKNLLEYSDLTHGYYSQSRITVVESATEASPINGGLPAYEITTDATEGVRLHRKPELVKGGNVATVSGYFKFQDLHVQLRIMDVGNGVAFVNFDLINGIVGNYGGTDLIDYSITGTSNGFWRCSLTTTNVADFGLGLVLIEDIQDEELPIISTQGLTLLAVDLQIEHGSVVTRYEPYFSGVGASDCFVPTLYDATGNGNDTTQSIATNQPKIYDIATTSVITENGKPALEWPSFLNNIKLGADVGSLPVGESFVVAKFEGEQFPTFNGLLTSFGNTDGATVSIGLIGNSVSDVWYSVAKWWNDLRHNGSQISTPFTAFPLIKDLSLVSFSSNAPVDIGGISIGFDRVFLNRGWQGTIQEVILFDSDQLTNRTAIENNINNYYGIY